ncbi:hypothetical protein PLICRDRAFT_700990 [Plicaturopsis crispa FD-325 SS-3]|nr:hypothetical protein PLICRDRAFT_700990 [Plicaturopsis crispa FD-325 SS-3]
MPETHNIVWQQSRPRSREVDALLSTTKDVTFEITRAVRTGAKHRSQYFFGWITGLNKELCLQLFDETFPSCQVAEYDDVPPEQRLMTLNRATDMDRKSIATTGFPICRVRRYLMATASTSSFIQTVGNQFQADLITRLRHCLRALKYAGVTQGDWHLNQILCPLVDIDAPRHHTVFIDFAFTRIHIDDDVGMPQSGDFFWLQGLLSSDTDLDNGLVEELWFPPNKHEW